MSLEVHDIVANLDDIKSLEHPDELQQLDLKVNQLFSNENPEFGISALLRVFERFPKHDGFGIFWSIVHGLESLSGYEPLLIESVKRQPSLFGLLMINRLLNGGFPNIQGEDLLNVLKEAATDESQTEEIRAEARHFVDWQRGEK
jgi:hypothetical protein